MLGIASAFISISLLAACSMTPTTPALSAAAVAQEAIRSKQVDIGFFAIDPLRGADTDYTAAYVVIEGTYVVPQASGIRVNADVDKPGTRIEGVAVAPPAAR